ncbi:MAG: acylase [Winogradskyella sp.]|nr:MAG: acylase [Winogradskyella sp.]
MKYVSLLLIALLFISCKTDKSYSSDTERWQEIADNITIIRDNFGVPHIYGKTDAEAVFGLLYAQCEDDFNRVEQNYIWATGRLAEVDGESAIYSDLRAKMFMTEDEAKANYEKSPEWLKELCNAFADGINYYLYTHPEITPRLITKFEPWMPMYFSEGSIGGDIERVSTRKIKAFYEGTDINQFQIEKEIKVKAEAEPAGSNGIAIHGKLTKSGNPILLINPHTSFFFRGEVHVVSEEGLNAYGAVTWGQFFVYQGFNEKTGWMHTSTYTDVIDEFEEDLVNVKDKLMYRYGEELREVKSFETTLKYIDGDSIKTKNFPFYRTHHGPITQSNNGKWVATAMMWEPVKALEQSYIRTKQNGYKGFREMMDIKTNSSNNTVYADAEGNIGYFHGNFIPKRNASFNYKQPVDGSNSKTDWQGLHEVDDHITLLNPENGWLQNCNSTPFTAAAENSPKVEDYPNYMSLNRENFRGVHAIDLLSKGKEYTLNSVIEMAHDSYLPAFQALLPGLVKAYYKQDAKNLDYQEAIDVLNKWDYTSSKKSVAMTLAHYYGMNVLRNGKRPKPMSTMEALNYFGNESPEDERVKIFESVITYLNETFDTWNIPWGEVNRYQRLNSDIKQKFDDNKPSIPVGFASGRWGALAAYGVSYTNPKAKKIYGTRGNSFVAVVEFGDKVKAKTMLAGGQSSDVNSPHFNDQAQRYADMEFKDVPYYKEDVLKVAEETYKPGQRQ